MSTQSASTIATTALRRRIMRRVWYSYGISIGTHPFFIHGVLLGGGLMLLRELVWIRRVIASFLAVPVGEAPGWIYERVAHAALDGNILLLLTLGVLTMTMLSLGNRLWHGISAPPAARVKHWQHS